MLQCFPILMILLLIFDTCGNMDKVGISSEDLDYYIILSVMISGCCILVFKLVCQLPHFNKLVFKPIFKQ